MSTVCVKSAVEVRRRYLNKQIDRLRAQLLKKGRAYYGSENTYRKQSKRTRELISELESELLMLSCPGEYDELPVAVVADELGLSYEQARSLIKLGEIEATGRQAHERITRGELERITSIGVTELMRLAQQDAADIFEQALQHLQSGDLDIAAREYGRLYARQSWFGPQAPAFLVGLELAKGELDGALFSVQLIYECEDPLRKLAIMTYLGRVLRGMRLQDSEARQVCDQLIIFTGAGFTKYVGVEKHQPKHPKKMETDGLQEQAMYFTTAVTDELREGGFEYLTGACPHGLEIEIHKCIRNAIYTALYAQCFYENSTASRLYVDRIRSVTPKRFQPAVLLGDLFKKSG